MDGRMLMTKKIRKKRREKVLCHKNLLFSAINEQIEVNFQPFKLLEDYVAALRKTG